MGNFQSTFPRISSPLEGGSEIDFGSTYRSILAPYRIHKKGPKVIELSTYANFFRFDASRLILERYSELHITFVGLGLFFGIYKEGAKITKIWKVVGYFFCGSTCGSYPSTTVIYTPLSLIFFMNVHLPWSIP